MLALRRMTHFRALGTDAAAHGTTVVDRESERVYKKQIDNRLRRFGHTKVERAPAAVHFVLFLVGVIVLILFVCRARSLDCSEALIV